MPRLFIQRKYLTFPSPVINAKTAYAGRSSLIVRLVDDFGHQGMGEASPLESFSSDSIGHAFDALQRVSKKDVNKLASLAPKELIYAAEQLTMSSPSASFALQSACLDLQAKQRGISIHRLLMELSGLEGACVLPLASWIDQSARTDLMHSALAAYSQGYRTFKIKLVSPSLYIIEQAKKLKTIGNVSIRFDANQMLSSSMVREMGERVAEIGAEFLEEPTSIDTMFAWRSFPAPVALDESLCMKEKKREVLNIIDRDFVKALILKPSVLGIHGCLYWIHQATMRHMDIIFSHLLEGPIAWDMIKSLALMWGSKAQGLGFHMGLEAWNVPSSYRATTIEIADGPGLSHLGLSDIWNTSDELA